MRLGLGPSSWSVPGSVPARTTSRPCPPRRTEASEIAFPPLVPWNRFSAQTISALGAYTVRPTLLGVSNMLGTLPSLSSSANGTRAIPRCLDICIYNLAKENSTFYLQLCIVDTEDMVSRCLKPRTRCRASVQPSVRAKASACRPWLRQVKARLAILFSVSEWSAPSLVLLVSITSTSSFSASSHRP